MAAPVKTDIHVAAAAGEGAGAAAAGRAANASSGAFAGSYLSVDVPLDGRGLVGIPANKAISPVFTVWCTLVLMYIGARSSTEMGSSVCLGPHHAARTKLDRVLGWCYVFACSGERMRGQHCPILHGPSLAG